MGTDASRLLGGTALTAALGLSVAHQQVDLGGSNYRSWGGGVLLHVNIVEAALVGLSWRSRLSLDAQGGQVGLSSRFAAETYVGAATRITKNVGLHVRGGLQGYGTGNDEVQATLLQLPAAEVGTTINVSNFTIAFGPTAGLALRTNYVLGDEDQGRRHRRQRTSDFAAGGFGAIAWKHFSIDASMTHLVAKQPLWVADGAACIHFGIGLCGFAQYWRSVASLAQPGVPPQADAIATSTLYVGAAIVLGFSSAATRDRSD